MSDTSSSTPASPLSTQPYTFSSFATKYGPGPYKYALNSPTSLQGLFKDAGPPGAPIVVKSGLTPFVTLTSSSGLGGLGIRMQKRLKRYQKSVLMGFTTQGLMDLGAIVNDPVTYKPLNVPIDRLFERHLWTAKPFNPCYMGGSYGMTPWAASQDDVWDILKPCLQLATCIMDRMTSHPWVSMINLSDGFD